MKDCGTTSYRWDPPKYTPEEARQARRATVQMIRKAAAGWDSSGEWQRAMGVIPKK